VRRNIVHIGAGELAYAIREIVEQAGRLEALGVTMAWENIGDPVQKGERIPDWIKDIVADLVRDDASYAYCPTRGEPATREFLATRVNARDGVQIGPNDILFFNGLGDAVSKALGFLRREARVIGPSPAYSTHSSAEGAHAGDSPLTYTLDPDRGWQPDLDEIRQKVRYNPSIAGILLINPDNPTGVVYSRSTLESVVEIARQFDLFVMCDEVYINITYNGAPAVHLSDVIGEVCGLSLKGISKEIPWPGSRCGWVEFYNQDVDPIFARFAKSLVDAKMLEVCSTTLPQRAIPRIMGDARYAAHLAGRAAEFQRRATEACAVLSGVQPISDSSTTSWARPASSWSRCPRSAASDTGSGSHCSNVTTRAAAGSSKPWPASFPSTRLQGRLPPSSRQAGTSPAARTHRARCRSRP